MGLLQVHPRRCKANQNKPKQSRCLIEKIKGTVARCGIWLCPLPSFAALSLALPRHVPTPMPTWYSSHLFGPRRWSALPSGKRAARAVPGGAVSSVFIDLQVPPAPTAPGETMGGMEGGKLNPSQALSPPQRKNAPLGSPLPRGAPHHHPEKPQAQSISCRSSSSCPTQLPCSPLRAGGLRPVPSAASLSRGSSRGCRGAGQGGGGLLAQGV